MSKEELPMEQVQESERLQELLFALLFVSGEPLSTAGLKAAVGSREHDGHAIRAALESLSSALDERGSGVRVVQVAGGWQLRSDPHWAPWIRNFTAKRPVRLSRSALECLAIVAYRQPATRTDVEAIRGVDSGAPVRTLLDRGLLRILGRRDEPGRPMIYGTTPYFLEVFGLRGLSDLPSLREFAELRPEELPEKAAEALRGAFDRHIEDDETIALSEDDGLDPEEDGALEETPELEATEQDSPDAEPPSEPEEGAIAADEDGDEESE